ncbi:MAG: hypothetical protein KTR18_14345 [Acidiferrobacterales bacterium]|nr:hypothetical protein [Acidiferrobacterales bacterium]
MDQKRIDIHATLRNPMGEIMVRKFNQKSATSIHVVADLSASIAINSVGNKLTFIRSLTRSLAFSARAYGDRFGFTGCNDQINLACSLPVSRDISGIGELLKNLQQDCLSGTGSSLAHAHVGLGLKPGIVFLVSDFLLPKTLLNQTLVSLSRHFVIPVVVGKRQHLPENMHRGLVSFKDSETGKSKTVFLRPSLIRKYKEKCDRFYTDLTGYFSRQQLRPLTVAGDFDADEISQYFYS